jgi:hypothetical protein
VLQMTAEERRVKKNQRMSAYDKRVRHISVHIRQLTLIGQWTNVVQRNAEQREVLQQAQALAEAGVEVTDGEFLARVVRRGI